MRAVRSVAGTGAVLANSRLRFVPEIGKNQRPSDAFGTSGVALRELYRCALVGVRWRDCRQTTQGVGAGFLVAQTNVLSVDAKETVDFGVAIRPNGCNPCIVPQPWTLSKRIGATAGFRGMETLLPLTWPSVSRCRLRAQYLGNVCIQLGDTSLQRVRYLA
jgi:hypothetical protein